MATSGSFLDRFRRPEYTGDNRCTQCTIVNTGIAVVVSVLVIAAIRPLSSLTVGVLAGLLVFFPAVAAIYLRGYLVPGTPAITKRYFPDWLLSVFGKEQDHEPAATASEFDPEPVLRELGTLEVCQGGDDLCLTDEFRAEWHEELDSLDDTIDREEIHSVLAIDESEVTYHEFGEASRATVDGTVVGQWESDAAFLADLSAGRLLSERHADWAGLPIAAKNQLLSGLRLFIDTCPACGGTPRFETETVESCCSTHEVAAVSCEHCGARLFESQPL